MDIAREVPAELRFSAPWSLGEQAFEAIHEDLVAIEARTVVEFGSGTSTARLAHDLPDVALFSVDSDATFFEQTRALLAAHGLEARVALVERPLAWRWHGGAPYLGFGEGELPGAIDAVLIDGPPHWTRRGREACLYAVFDRLRVGGRVYLDDYGRRAEKRTVRNWLLAYPGALRMVRMVPVDCHVAILEKTSERPHIARSWTRLMDAYGSAALQPISATVRRASFWLRSRGRARR
jgi:predicted O-methyltransferase YrrM